MERADLEQEMKVPGGERGQADPGGGTQSESLRAPVAVAVGRGERDGAPFNGVVAWVVFLRVFKAASPFLLSVDPRLMYWEFIKLT